MHFTQFVSPSFFVSCENTAIGIWFKQAMWGFAIVETIHIMALTVLLGTVLLADLHLLGFVLQRRPAPRLARDLAPFTYTALAVAVVTGICMFLSEAVRLGESDPFLFKIVFFVTALIVQFTLYRSATHRDNRKGLDKAIACLSLALWLGVALAGRGIAFL